MLPDSIKNFLLLRDPESSANYCLKLPIRKLRCLLINYYISLISRDYEVTEDSFDKDLMLKIFNTERTEDLNHSNRIAESSQFLQHLVQKLPDAHGFNVINVSIEFLHLYIKSLESSNDYSVAVFCLLLSYHLKPLASLYVSDSSAGSVQSGALQKNEIIITLLMKVIMISLPHGLKFNHRICVDITKEYCDSVQSYYELFIVDEPEKLSKFQDFLKYDNPDALINVVQTLTNLCKNVEIEKKNLFLIFFSVNSMHTLANMLEFLVLYTSRLELVHLLAELFIEIKKLTPVQNGVISQKTRILFYATMLKNSSNKDFELIEAIMKAFGDDVTSCLLNAFVKINITDNLAQHVLRRFDIPCVAQRLNKVVLESIDHDVKVAVMASRLMTWAVFQIDEAQDEKMIFALLPETLEKSLPIERVFASLLEILLLFDGNVLENYQFNRKKKLIDVLGKAFLQFEHPAVLTTVTKVFAKFVSIAIQEIARTMATLFRKSYDELLQAETSEIVDSPNTVSFDYPMMKLNILLESNLFVFLNYFKSEAIVIINSKKLQEPDDPAFPFAARLQVTVLSEIFENLVAEQGMQPFDVRFILNAVTDLSKTLFKQLERRDLNILQAKDIFTSLIDILHRFHLRPKLFDNEKKILSMDLPKITVAQLIVILKFAEFYVFKIVKTAFEGIVGEQFYDVQFQEEILTKLAELIRTNPKIPNMSSLSMLLQYYGNCEKFQLPLEKIMKAFRKQQILATTLALAIVNFSKQPDNFKKLKKFIACFQTFVESTMQDACGFKVQVGKIAVNLVLSSTERSPVVEGENRLSGLLEVNYFVKTAIQEHQSELQKKIIEGLIG